jgi:hypothetical protein
MEGAFMRLPVDIIAVHFVSAGPAEPSVDLYTKQQKFDAKGMLCRLIRDKETRGYMARRIAEGKTKKEVIRCHKRNVARQVYRVILEDLKGSVQDPQTTSNRRLHIHRSCLIVRLR